MATELPPRARRILGVEFAYGFESGTTSACAENTTEVSIEVAPLGNYLRVRGEYWKVTWVVPPLKELPPRARRILALPTIAKARRGTTSACAENTKEMNYAAKLLRRLLANYSNIVLNGSADAKPLMSLFAVISNALHH